MITLLITASAVIACALSLGIFWGASENRLWKEAGEGIILNHFKLYHFCMAVLFGSFNAIAILSANLLLDLPIISLKPFLEWTWLMVWDTLVLDVVWWTIRYQDITHLGEVLFAWKLLEWEWVVTYPEVNEYDFGKGKPWHSREDWDNWLHPPLILGTYPWWFLFASILVVNGGVLCLL